MPSDLLLAQAQPLVPACHHDLCPGAPDGVDQHLLVVGRGGAKEQDVDADDLDAGGVDRIDEPRQQGAVDRQARLVLAQRLIGDADDGDVGMLARQLVGEGRGAHVGKRMLKTQQAGGVAWHDVGQQHGRKDGHDPGQDERSRK